MRHGVIYKITNKINGKAYIGQTTTTISFRWKAHLRTKTCRYLHHAIVKYGQESFMIEELATCSSHEDLDLLERIVIEQEKTLVPYGYNLRTGGHANSKLSDETKKRFSEVRIGIPRTGRSAKGNARYCTQPSSRPVMSRCVVTGLEIGYKTASFAREEGFFPASILNNCKGKTGQHKGRWWWYADQEPPEFKHTKRSLSFITKHQNRSPTTVRQNGKCRIFTAHHLDTNQQEQFIGIAGLTAAGFEHTGVYKAISGKCRTYKRRIWKSE